jgi:predicted dehydrogenase
MVGRLLLFHPAMRKLKELIELEELGQLSYVHAARTEPGPEDENNLWIFLASELSALTYLLPEEPREIIAHGLWRQPSDMYQALDAHIAFGNGVACRVHVSVLDARRVHKVVAVGSKATAVFDGIDPAGTLTKHERGGDIITLRVPLDDPQRLEADYFISAVRSAMSTPLGVRNAVAVVQLIEAFRQSLASGGVRKTLVRSEEGEAAVVPFRRQGHDAG